MLETVETHGTKIVGKTSKGLDLSLEVSDLCLIDDGVALVRSILKALEGNEAVVEPDSTFRYGYWAVRLHPGVGASGPLTVSELNADGSEYVAGAELTLRFWRDQRNCCAKFDATFAPPHADQMVAVSEGVYDGLAVQAVRYPAPNHMSGWYVTTSRFNGDVETLSVEHLKHLTARRPELGRYLALPYGSRFDTTSGQDDVWFDAEVANDSP